jgi:hypothetical protein
LEFAENYQRELLTERGMETETQIIEVLSKIAQENAAKVSIKFLTERFIERFADDYERKITPRWIGSIVRKKLGLKTYKFHGSFVIPEKELSKIEYLTVKYGVFTGETGSEHSR